MRFLRRPFRAVFALGLALALAALPPVSGAAPDVRIHVAAQRKTGNEDGSRKRPFHSAFAALKAAEAIANAQPAAKVRIVFASGVHRIDRPLLITRKCVPTQGSLELTAADGAAATISGGVELSDWKVQNDGTWVTRLPQAVMAGETPRELFADGVRRTRARHPNSGYLRVVAAFPDKRSGFTFQAADLPHEYHGGGELVFLHDWSASRIPVKQVDHAAHKLTTEHPIGNRAPHYKIDHFEKHPRYYLENHLAFLDQPGEWFIEDGGTVRYRPLAGETPQKTRIVVPVAAKLLVVRGNDDAPIRNVTLRRLTFQYAAWSIPKQGYAGSQATWFENRGGNPSAGRTFVPAAIQLSIAENCRIEACRIQHLGGSGVELGTRTRACVLEDSLLTDISGNGVNVGEDRSRRAGSGPWWQSAPKQVADGNVVQFNRITHCGRQFFGAVAVWCGITKDARIVHNEIANHPYTGVSVGWMWNPTPTPARGNVVSHNHIHHVMQVLSDGGGIYTLGHQPGTRLTNNVIHDVPLNAGRAESNGMFLDEGSDLIEIAHNTIYGIDRSPLRFHKAKQMNVHDNLLVVPAANIPPYRYNATDPATVQRVNDRVMPGDSFDQSSVVLPEVGPRVEID